LYLTYRERVFTFSFAALDYSNPGKNRYTYLMEGFEDKWNFVENQTSATYTNLSPGKYVFRVRGTNADGVWSRHEAALNLVILPPFWKTRWFISLAILIIIGLAFFIIRKIIKTQKKKAREEREKIELQLKTIKNQIDPHFAFNAMNMIGSLVYNNDPDAVYDYFSRFAHLIRSTLTDSEKISRSLGEELEFVKNYLEIQKARFRDKFDYVLNVADNTELDSQVPKMIIQAYAENAIKHGLIHKNEKGLLEINVHQKNNSLHFSVRDNGIGRENAAALSKDSTGKGTGIIKQILDMYGQLFRYRVRQEVVDLKDNSGNPAGTEVKLTIIKNGRPGH
jgi:LytS/YehU family sensor histidine kinase